MAIVVVAGADVLSDRFVRDFLLAGSAETRFLRYRVTWSRSILDDLEDRWRNAGRSEGSIATIVGGLNESIDHRLTEPSADLIARFSAIPHGHMLATAAAT